MAPATMPMTAMTQSNSIRVKAQMRTLLGTAYAQEIASYAEPARQFFGRNRQEGGLACVKFTHSRVSFTHLEPSSLAF
jgi:hypothetical protein